MCAHLPPGPSNTLSRQRDSPRHCKADCSADILQVFSSSPLAVEKLSYDEFWGVHKYVVASNELHELYAGPADRFHEVFDLDDGVLKLLQEEIDERGRTPLHILAGNAQAYTHVLAEVGVQSICFNDEALTKQDNKGETPIDIALWVLRGCATCMHQWVIGGVRSLSGSNHDRMQTVTSGSTCTMTSWCVKCSKSTILNFLEVLLLRARYTATPSCFLLFE